MLTTSMTFVRDEIMVLPKYETKNLEVTRGISTILYQMAVAAKVILDL